MGARSKPGRSALAHKFGARSRRMNASIDTSRGGSLRSNEFSRIARLRARFGETSRASEIAGFEIGIGDDAAVLRPPPGRLVWTIDEQLEGTHFRRAWLGYDDIGWRSFMAAASDVAAMGARPW